MNQHVSDRERFVAGAWYLATAQVLGIVTTYASVFVLTRMGTERYGLWVLVLLLVSYMVPWSTLGLGDALMRFCPTYASAQQRYRSFQLSSRTCLFVSLGLVALVVAVARPLAELLLGGVGQAPLIAVGAFLVLLEVQFQLGNNYLLVEERTGLYALLTLSRYICEVAVLAVLVLWGFDLRIMLGARGLVVLAFVVVQHLVTVTRNVGGVARDHFGWQAELGEYLRFGFPMIPAMFIWSLVAGVDRFMLEHLANLAEVAIYNLADVMAALLLNCTRPINGILQPRFANMVNQDPGEVQRYLAGAVKFLAVVLFPGAVGLAVVAGPLVRLLGHQGFEGAAGMIPVLALAYVLIGMSNPLYHLVFLRCGGKQFLLLYPLCLGVNVLLNLLLIPRFGGQGAAVATLCSFAIYVGGLIVWSESKILRTFARQWRVLGLIAGCSLAMGGVLEAAKGSNPAFDSVALVPLGVAVYGVLLCVTKVITQGEWQLLVSPITKLRAVVGTRLRTMQR